MSDPVQASPADSGASNSTAQKNPPAGKQARFRIRENTAFPGGSGVVLEWDGHIAGYPQSAIGLSREEGDVVCQLLNAIDAERRGDVPQDVQRQLLEELRAIVAHFKSQAQAAAERDAFVSALINNPEKAGEVARRFIESIIGPMFGGSPEGNVNDLMLDVVRGFGLSDGHSRSVTDLRGFCHAVAHMKQDLLPQSVRERMTRLEAALRKLGDSIHNVPQVKVSR